MRGYDRRRVHCYYVHCDMWGCGERLWSDSNTGLESRMAEIGWVSAPQGKYVFDYCPNHAASERGCETNDTQAGISRGKAQTRTEAEWAATAASEMREALRLIEEGHLSHAQMMAQGAVNALRYANTLKAQKA